MRITIKKKITKGFLLFLLTFFSVGVQAAEWNENENKNLLDLLDFFYSHDQGLYENKGNGNFVLNKDVVNLTETGMTTGASDIFFHVGPNFHIWSAFHLKGPYRNGVNEHGVTRELIGYTWDCGSCDTYKLGKTLAEGMAFTNLTRRPIYAYTFPDDGFSTLGVAESDDETSNQAPGGGSAPAPPPPPPCKPVCEDGYKVVGCECVKDCLQNHTNNPENLKPSEAKLSQKAIDLLKAIEKLRLVPYDDETGKPITNYVHGATIGYGHLITNATAFDKYKNGISTTAANTLFLNDIDREIKSLRKISHDLSQNQFDALAILVFNIGTQFNSSSLRKFVEDCDAKTNYSSVENAWKAFNIYNRVISQGLINRRKCEWDIFVNGIYKQW